MSKHPTEGMPHCVKLALAKIWIAEHVQRKPITRLFTSIDRQRIEPLRCVKHQ